MRAEKAVVVLAYIWRYTSADGRTDTRWHSNHDLSMQTDVLSGRAGVCATGALIPPGSKRLITQNGICGDNRDVLPPEPEGRWLDGKQGGRWKQALSGGNRVAIELSLDAAIFEDGLCAGPDEMGMFESITAQLQQQRDTAAQITEALRGGASAARCSRCSSRWPRANGKR